MYGRLKSLVFGSGSEKRFGNRKKTASYSVRWLRLVKATSSVPVICGAPGSSVARRVYCGRSRIGSAIAAGAINRVASNAPIDPIALTPALSPAGEGVHRSLPGELARIHRLGIGRAETP